MNNKSKNHPDQPDLWVRSKVSRFEDPALKNNKLVGPGRYTVNKLYEPTYKKGMSSSFM